MAGRCAWWRIRRGSAAESPLAADDLPGWAHGVPESAILVESQSGGVAGAGVAGAGVAEVGVQRPAVICDDPPAARVRRGAEQAGADPGARGDGVSVGHGQRGQASAQPPVQLTRLAASGGNMYSAYPLLVTSTVPSPLTVPALTVTFPCSTV